MSISERAIKAQRDLLTQLSSEILLEELVLKGVEEAAAKARDLVQVATGAVDLVRRRIIALEVRRALVALSLGDDPGPTGPCAVCGQLATRRQRERGEEDGEWLCADHALPLKEMG